MPYTPINVDAYTAAFAGAIAGMTVSGWITNATAASYTDPTQIAGAFAEAFDTVWNNATQLNELELSAITSVVAGDFRNRQPGPLASTAFKSASNWLIAASACVALILECDIYFTGQGIVPSSSPSAGVITTVGTTAVPIPANKTLFITMLANSGAGGGSGASEGVSCSGGSGGGRGGSSLYITSVAALLAQDTNVNFTIPDGGAGGIAVSGGASVGNDGSPGGITTAAVGTISFTGCNTVAGPGLGGVIGSRTGGLSPACLFGVANNAGGATDAANGSAPATNEAIATGGGGGGGLTSSGTAARTGGNGGLNTIMIPSQTTGGAIATSGQSGTDPTFWNFLFGLGGAGGGSAVGAAVGGSGGNGGAFGGGGGGGGSANGTSGAGGKGGPGGAFYLFI